MRDRGRAFTGFFLRRYKELVKEISGHELSTQAVRALEEQYSTLIELSPDGILLLRGRQIIFANHKAEEMFGFAEPHIVGEDLEELLSRSLETTLLSACPAERQAIQESLDKATSGTLGSNVSIQYEIPIRHEGGELLWIEVSASSSEHDGELVGLAILRDATARKRAEAALRSTEQYYRRLIEKAPDGFVVINLDATLRTASASCEQILGYPLRDLQHLDIIKLLHPDDMKCAIDLFQRLVHNPGVVVSANVRCQRTDGSWAHIEGVGTNYAQDPAIAGVIVNLRDVTDRKRTEQELEHYASDLLRTNEELEQFAYIASHDLREPIRMVKLYTQLLAKEYKGKLGVNADEYVEYMVEGVDHMNAMIDGLRAYAQICASHPVLEPVDCNEVMKCALAALQQAIGENKAVVTHDPLPRVKGDLSQLIRLFRHLIDNSLKFRGEQPPLIHISAEHKDKEWLFAVRDNGIGIEREYCERIFIIFERLHLKDEYEGTGVGLTLCKKIVERHGGRIWVESDLGQGATFYFTLLALDQEEHTPAKQPQMTGAEDVIAYGPGAQEGDQEGGTGELSPAPVGQAAER